MCRGPPKPLIRHWVLCFGKWKGVGSCGLPSVVCNCPCNESIAQRVYVSVTREYFLSLSLSLFRFLSLALEKKEEKNMNVQHVASRREFNSQCCPNALRKQ